MGRYRPPQPVGSKYITAKGHERLKQEHDYLWKKKRPEVTRILSAAAAEGDRSENAEYIYRKKELAGIDRRIRYLQKRLPDLTIVSAGPSDPDRIFFGAYVVLKDEAGDEHRYRIVGPDEFDPEKGWISMDSPMAQALMKKTFDDEVNVTTPIGERQYCVIGIRYET